MRKSLKIFVIFMAALAFVGGIIYITQPRLDPRAVFHSGPDFDVITLYPNALDPNCNYGRPVLFDECGSQRPHFEAALTHANAQGKILLVSYGAEWCIWCHVFDAYLKGQSGIFEYQFGRPGDRHLSQARLFERADGNVGDDALALARFASDHFVIVHIENQHAPDGADVLDDINAWVGYDGGVPYNFIVTSDGEYLDTLQEGDHIVRRDNGNDWFRGYDRVGLLGELQRVRDVYLAAHP